MMTTLRRFNYLSIWEIAHHYHGADPDETDENDLPKKVKDKMRELLSCTEDLFTIYDVNGEPCYGSIPLIAFIPWLNKLNWDTTPHINTIRALELSKIRFYPKLEINQFFLNKDHFEEYCFMRFEELPEFWFRDSDRQYHHDKLQRRINTYFDGKWPSLYDTANKLEGSTNQNDAKWQLYMELVEKLWNTGSEVTITDMSLDDDIVREGNVLRYASSTILKFCRKVAPARISKMVGKGKSSRNTKS